MANTFSRQLSANIGNIAQAVGDYTVPISTTAVVVGLTVCNRTGSTINVDVSLFDGGEDFYIVKNAPISAGGALVPVGGDQKIVMGYGDQLRVVSDAVSSVDAIMSIMEIT